MNKTRVHFRADGSTRSGLGHIFRSIALAQIIQPEFTCCFWAKDLMFSLKETIQETFETVHEIDSKLSVTEEAAVIAAGLHPSDIFVTDGYHFTTEYQQIIKRSGCMLVCVDDIHSCHYVADVVLNHAGGLGEKDYSFEWFTQLNLGTRYAILRKPFWQTAKPAERKSKEVFICLGGADPDNETEKVLSTCLAKTPDLHFHVITGAAYLFGKELQEMILSCGATDRVTLYSSLSGDEMVRMMDQCAVAITSPSTVSYEYLARGGTLYLHRIADNQAWVNKYFTETGLAADFNSFPTGGKPASLESGYTDNLRKIFQELSLESAITLRHAIASDARCIFDWVNDPEVRRQSFSSDPITWENHLQWFEKKLQSQDTRFYILEKKGQPVGQIRFDIRGQEAVIGYLLDAAWRGKGLGRIVLKKGVQALLQNRPDVNLIAGSVKQSNPASCRAFEKLHFSREDVAQYEASYRYTLKISA